MRRFKSVFIFTSTIFLVRMGGTRCDRWVKISRAVCGAVAVIISKPSSLGCWSRVCLGSECPDMTIQMLLISGTISWNPVVCLPQTRGSETLGWSLEFAFQHLLLLLFLLNHFSLTDLFDTFFHFLRDIFIEVERIPGRWYYKGHLLFFLRI